MLIKVLIGLNIVLIVSVILFLLFRYISRLRKYRPSGANEMTDRQNHPRPEIVPEGDKAAIAMALYLYFNEIHDQESDIITVKRVSKTYSPWSSKLYSMRNLR
jgi:hypothetical protein